MASHTAPVFPLRPTQLPRILALVAAGLVVASLAGSVSAHVLGHGRLLGLVPLLALDVEGNVPTLFATLLLLLAMALLAMTAVLEHRAAARDRRYWTLLAGVFALLAADEAMAIHEQLSAPLRALLGAGPFGLFHFAWVIPGFMLVAVAGVVFLRFLLRLPSPTRARFVVAGTLFVGGALGLESLSGAWAASHGSVNLGFALLTTVEEALEMAGVIVLIHALLDYLAASRTDLGDARAGGDRPASRGRLAVRPDSPALARAVGERATWYGRDAVNGTLGRGRDGNEAPEG